jgi:hypothetical protein
MFSAPVRWTALIGATAVTVAVLWRDHRGSPTPASANTLPPATAVDAAPRVAPAAMPAPAPVAAASARPPAMPYSYVGSWRERDRLHLYLRRGDVTYSIQGPGPLGDDYAVVAADEDRVSLRYLPLGSVQVLRRVAPPPATAQQMRPHILTPAGDAEAQAEN